LSETNTTFCSSIIKVNTSRKVSTLNMLKIESPQS
jgi:hypothetical protein